MNIYVVYRTDRIGYDEFDSFVCCAKTAKEAMSFAPVFVEQNDFPIAKTLETDKNYLWTTTENLKAVKIGETTIDDKVIFNSSFNAG